ncbi:uncharacterized protein FRV6_15548 [Fusarium oxysporum]|uniref:Uncharacterized protein n=1 Tax=Fusarium oxysporum TaxID=5507 RepID=A0A2H3U368_FUSOX|nr:uncharacterized protein FRV6_15548 [Fusarium oxysporum]
MISRNLLSGTVVLLAASLANAGPCRPSSIISSSTVIASISETATSTASIDATQTTAASTESESETETGTTVTVETTPSASSIETTATALVDTTTTALAITSAETTTEATTTTAAATTTSEEPEALQTIFMYARGSNDPSLAPIGGTGFTELTDTRIPDVEYITFTTDVSSPLFFTVGERSGKVRVGNGGNQGKVAGYFPVGLDYSFVIATEATLGEENGVTPIDCEIVNGNGFQKLQCQFGDEGNADFWTCGGDLVFVSPGHDFTSKCASAATSYKLAYIEVVNTS